MVHTKFVYICIKFVSFYEFIVSGFAEIFVHLGFCFMTAELFGLRLDPSSGFYHPVLKGFSSERLAFASLLLGLFCAFSGWMLRRSLRPFTVKD